MTSKDQEPKHNDARQSGADQPAFGQDARDFGAGGQDVLSTGGNEQREVERDTTLDEAGETAARRAR